MHGRKRRRAPTPEETHDEEAFCRYLKQEATRRLLLTNRLKDWEETPIYLRFPGSFPRDLRTIITSGKVPAVWEYLQRELLGSSGHVKKNLQSVLLHVASRLDLTIAAGIYQGALALLDQFHFNRFHQQLRQCQFELCLLQLATSGDCIGREPNGDLIYFQSCWFETYSQKGARVRVAWDWSPYPRPTTILEVNTRLHNKVDRLLEQLTTSLPPKTVTPNFYERWGEAIRRGASLPNVLVNLTLAFLMIY